MTAAILQFPDPPGIAIFVCRDCCWRGDFTELQQVWITDVVRDWVCPCCKSDNVEETYPL